MGMNELLVTLGDRSYRFGTGATVRIGRSPDNDIVVSDPTVSRRHAEFRPGPAGWEFENVGRALSFLDGAPVTRASLDGSAQIQLSSMNGPVLAVSVGQADTPAPVAPAESAPASRGRHGGPAVSAYQGGPYAGSGSPDGGFEADPAWPDYQQPGYQRAGSAAPEYPAAEYSAAEYEAPDYPEKSYPEKSYPEQSYPEQSYPEHPYPEPAYREPERPEPGQPEPEYQSGGFAGADYQPPDFQPDLFRPDSSAVPPLPVLPSVEPAASSSQPGLASPEAFGDSGDSSAGFPPAGDQAERGDAAGSGYPSRPDYLGPAEPGAQPDYPVRSGWPDPSGSAEQPGYPAPSDYPGQADYPGQSDYPGQAAVAAPAEAAARTPDGTSVMEVAPGLRDPAGDRAGPAAVSPGTAGSGADGAAPAAAVGAYPPAGGYSSPGGNGGGAYADGGYPYADAGNPYPDYPGGQPGQPGHEVPRIRQAGAQPVDEIATALHILLPVRSWLHDPGWRQFLRLLVIPYGLLPLIFIALFASSSNLSTPGWAYSLYIAPLWAIAFWLLIRPGKVERQEVLIGVGAIFFSLIWIRVVTVHVNDLMGPPGKPLSFAGAIGVGLNEEITKALPILLAALLLLKYRSTKLDVRMWMFLGTIVGLAFGVTEQAGYTLQDIQGITAAQANSQAIVEVLAFAERVFVDGFQHAMWAGVSAFFIGMAVNYPRRRYQLIAFGVALPAVLHGLYDWSASAFGSLWIPIIIQALSLFLFLGYTMSAAAIERQVRRTPMFRGESMLMERISGISERPGRSHAGQSFLGERHTGPDEAAQDHGGYPQQASHGAHQASGSADSGPENTGAGASGTGHARRSGSGRVRYIAPLPPEESASPYPAPAPATGDNSADDPSAGASHSHWSGLRRPPE
jgi:RsiW-degrading membrane proteinase PrsW (M82 family)